MATLSHAQSRRMYSWWWDSHISPKNSKWLQENLTDMDAKVKQMIKLIEEDADSFARRAEMYYKKRPELMKMVEEFYRAYRALAERYDHATGVIRQAHRTMTEVFPNQVPLVPGDDSPVSSAASEGDPHTPEMPPATRAMFDPDELHKDALGLSSSNFHAIKRNGSAEGRVKKGLNFNDIEEKEQQTVLKGANHNIKARVLSEAERGSKFEREIINLKEALAKLDAEKVAGLLQYQQGLEKLSNLETEVVRAQEDSRGLNERSSKAEAEVQTLKEDLTKSEAEREASLLQYQQCLDKISNLEKSITLAQENADELNERAKKAETEAQAVKHDLSVVEAEKEAVLVQNSQLLIKVSDFEKKLLQAEEDARRISEQADKAESDVEALKQALAKLTEEKEAAALQYQQCLETISILEHQITCSQEEAQRLNSEISDAVSKIKGTEERCLQLETSNQSLQSELESLVQKMGTQDQELTQKQQEVGTLWTCVKEERLRFMEVESAFQALQHLHSESQEELRSLATELQQRAQVLKELESHNDGLQDEVQKVKEENRSLNEHNLSSAVSIKNMQDELASLREARGRLEEEVELRVDQRNALQQEIYCLKEEINELKKKHQAVLEQVDSVGLNSECFGSAVKKLQDENSELHEVCHRERNEKIALFEKLEIMAKLLEKNAVLENSLSDLSVELEALREKVKELEESCQFYLGEKSVLVAEKVTIFAQLQITTENLGKLSEKNAFLENSLFDANAELEGFRAKMKSLEDSCQLLDTEKSVLFIEKESLVSQLQISQQKLEDLEKNYTELEEKYAGLEKERDSTLCRVEELRVSLDVEKQEHAKLNQLSATRLADLESHLSLLQEESRQRKKELEEELDEAVNAQIEIFILQKCVKDVEEENVSLLVQSQKLSEASKLSEKLILELEHEKLENQVEVKSFIDQINKMRTWMYQVLKALDIDSYHGCDDIFEQDRTHVHHILGKIEDNNCSLSKTLDENQQLILENLVLSTLLGQLRLEASNLESDKNTHQQELKTRIRELSGLQNENQSLEEENCGISSEAISLSCLSLIFKNTVIEKFAELKELRENLDEIHGVNGVMEEKLKRIQGNLEMARVENHLLKESLDKSDTELKTVRYVCDQLNIDVASGKELLHQKEVKLLEAEQKLQALQNEQMELQNLMEDLKRKFDEVNVIKEDQEKQILKLSEENDVQNREGERLRDLTQTLEAKLLTLDEEHEEIKVREKTWSNEAELWETEGTAFFCELQISAIQGLLFAEKIHELNKACQNLEGKSNSNSMEIENLKERVGTLEDKNEGLEAQLAACIPAINSLERSIASLENYTLQRSEVDKSDNEKEVKDDKLETHLLAESCGELSENLNAKVPEEFPNLQGLEARIKAIEKALIEMERLAAEEKLNNNREIEADTSDDPKLQKLAHEISETGSEVLTKDIMLDQISECSPYGISRRDTIEADDPMLELWETTDQNGSIDLKVGKGQKVVVPTSYHQIKAAEKDESRNPSSEIQILTEKELSVDKLEISKRFAEPRQEGNRKNILERLASDAQKLTNLQITVQDLMRKVEITEKSKKGKGIEYGSVKEQLEESDEAILKLFDINKKLMNSAEENALPSEERSAADSEESGSIRRRRVSEQARKGSEKIGRLQLEVQKLQFLLLKLDDEKESKIKTRITERKTRVLLRDYLYGGIIRPSHKRKKASFCACVGPPTKGD